MLLCSNEITDLQSRLYIRPGSSGFFHSPSLRAMTSAGAIAWSHYPLLSCGYTRYNPIAVPRSKMLSVVSAPFAWEHVLANRFGKAGAFSSVENSTSSLGHVSVLAAQFGDWKCSTRGTRACLEAYASPSSKAKDAHKTSTSWFSRTSMALGPRGKERSL